MNSLRFFLILRNKRWRNETLRASTSISWNLFEPWLAVDQIVVDRAGVKSHCKSNTTTAHASKFLPRKTGNTCKKD